MLEVPAAEASGDATSGGAAVASRSPAPAADGEPCAAGTHGPRGRRPVLLVVHQATSSPGHVGRWFRDHGFPLDIRRPFAGDALPATLAGHAGAVVFGGPQSANDADAYISREIDFVGVALAERRPFLGICLGAQLLARHLGARVDHCPMGSVEIGYHPIVPTAAGRRLGLPERVYQWHREGFDLPTGAVALAVGGNAYPNQAFAVGAMAVGVQFHPEITLTQVGCWSGSNSTRLLLRGARPRAEHLDDHLVHGRVVQRWLDSFLGAWVAGRLPIA